MSKSDQRPKVTVEDLLRLKRAERPAAEFWTNFERELRQKQLTALLNKRSWWQELPQLFTRRAYLPVGATAILAFTLISVKFYTPAQIAQAGVPASGPVSRESVAAVPTTLASAPVSSPLVNRSENTAPVMDDRTAVAATAVVTELSTDTVELMPRLLASREVETPSARSIAANLEVLEQSQPELVNAVMGSRLSQPARVQTAAAVTTELASIPTNAVKRNRLFAYSDRQLSPEPTAPEIVRERLSRRLGDNEIFDRLNRVGLKGDQVSLGLTLRL